MRKCIDMRKGRKIIINDKDTLKPDGTLEIPDIGLGEAYLGKASYVVYLSLIHISEPTRH